MLSLVWVWIDQPSTLREFMNYANSKCYGVMFLNKEIVHQTRVVKVPHMNVRVVERKHKHFVNELARTLIIHASLPTKF